MLPETSVISSRHVLQLLGLRLFYASGELLLRVCDCYGTGEVWRCSFLRAACSGLAGRMKTLAFDIWPRSTQTALPRSPQLSRACSEALFDLP